jgi:cephalosporin hydroxylase
MRVRVPTRAGFAVWRDETRTRVERTLAGPLRNSYLRLYHDVHLHPRNFKTGTEADAARATWLGVPTWKLPSDMWVYQEIIFETRPDLIVETGTQYGGSTRFYASVLDELGAGEIVTIDIDTADVHPDVRAHPRITVIEASSTDPAAVEEVRRRAEGKRVMVVLDSDHQQPHVAEELRVWSDLVSPGCYLVVEDTALGTRYLPGWGGSLAALEAWLPDHPDFVRDTTREKFLVTVNPGGYLRRANASSSSGGTARSASASAT